MGALLESNTLPESLAYRSPGDFTGGLHDDEDVISPEVHSENRPVLRVLIQGDGRKMNKNRGNTQLAFSILNEGYHVLLPHKKYTLALINGSENQDMGLLIEPLLQDMRSLANNGFTLPNSKTKCEVEFFLSGDWKFLQVFQGVPSPTSKSDFCVWCRCDSSNAWSGRARAFATELATLRKLKDFTDEPDQGGLKYKPIFDFIPFDHVIIDVLHLFLRVSDKLISLCIHDVYDYGGSDALDIFESEVRKCGVNFEWLVPKEDDGKGVGRDNAKDCILQWRDLDGTAKKRILQDLDLEAVFEGCPKYANQISDLWDSFLKIYAMLKEWHPDLKRLRAEVDEFKHLFAVQGQGTPGPGSPRRKSNRRRVKKFRTEDFQNDTTGFIKGLYHNSDTTPYIHALFHHVFAMIRKHDNLIQFSCYGLEKMNHVHSRIFFSSTSRGGGKSGGHNHSSVLRQIFQKCLRKVFNPSSKVNYKYKYYCIKCGHGVDSSKWYQRHIQNCERR